MVVFYYIRHKNWWMKNLFVCVCVCGGGGLVHVLIWLSTNCGHLWIILQDQYAHRRMSDPSTGWNNFLRGSFKRSGIRKSRSEQESVDSYNNGCAEVEANDIQDGEFFYLSICFIVTGPHCFLDCAIDAYYTYYTFEILHIFCIVYPTLLHFSL